MHLSRWMECNLILGTLSMFTYNQDCNTLSESLICWLVFAPLQALERNSARWTYTWRSPRTSETSWHNVWGTSFWDGRRLMEKVLDLDRWNGVSSLSLISHVALSHFCSLRLILENAGNNIFWGLYNKLNNVCWQWKHWFITNHHTNAWHNFSQKMTYG